MSQLVPLHTLEGEGTNTCTHTHTHIPEGWKGVCVPYWVSEANAFIPALNDNNVMGIITFNENYEDAE